MTKRIVSGIFILAALGALGVILAGALTSGEQLIVRFLTAVIVAALGLYVISDLRLQTGEADQPMESRSRADAEPSAPHNSTAAYMAIVTDGYGTDPARLARRDAHSERRQPAPPQPTRPSMPSVTERPDDFDRSYAPARPLAEPSEATARVVQSGPPPMPPPGPAPMEPVTKARRGLAALDRDDAVATAPIPITRWTSGDDHGDDGNRFRPIEAVGATAGGSGNGTGDGTASGESVTTDSGSDPTRSAPESAGTSGSVGDSGSDGPTYSNLGSFRYSGRLDTATTWWPEPDAEDRPTTEDSTTGLDESEDRGFETDDGMTDGEFDPSSGAITSEVVDIRSRFRAVPDNRTDGNGHDDPRSTGSVDAAIPNQDADDATIDKATTDSATTDDATTDDEVTLGDPVILEAPSLESDAAPAETIAELQDAETVDTGQQMPEHRDPTPYLEDVHHQATEGVATATPENEVRSLDAAVEHRPAACRADTPGTPMSMIDLRDGSGVEPEGVVKAIQAGEHQVIQTLIRQGMLSTSGPITDRDVRTMVYVAFTSNELRKLIVAGGRPDTGRADLELGPVELFDERRFAPTPRTLYTRPDPRPVELPPTGIEITDDASDLESEPSTEGEPTVATMPAPRHVYRFDADSSPETVA